MQIQKINIYPILLPFSAEFSHSLRKRSSVNNVVVEVIAENGSIKGYGEGAPRSYVTGESQNSVKESIWRLTQKNRFPWTLRDVVSIWSFIDSLPNGSDHNAAVCALETALLDALGRHLKKNVIDFFPNNFLAETVFYGATIPLDNDQRILQLCRLCKKMKINTLRIKIGKDLKQNKKMMEMVRSVFADDYNLRVDINGVWDYKTALSHIELFKAYNVKVVEQPLNPDDAGSAEVSKQMIKNDIMVMADESACSLNDVKEITDRGYCNMINVRLSKCGGFRKSLEIIDYLRSNHIQFQIGCHLGESGILSAAGRVLCLLCRDAVYYDGSYDEYLLKENITRHHVSFGPHGKAGPLSGPGLGVDIDRQRLHALCLNGDIVTLANPKS
jgi:muconate cycloisomerase